MIKYRAGAGFLSLAMACSLIMPVSAEDYSDTETWYAKCSQAQTSQSGVKACQGFQEYQKDYGLPPCVGDSGPAFLKDLSTRRLRRRPRCGFRRYGES